MRRQKLRTFYWRNDKTSDEIVLLIQKQKVAFSVEFHSKKCDEIDWIFTCSGLFCCWKTKETRAKEELEFILPSKVVLLMASTPLIRFICYLTKKSIEETQRKHLNFVHIIFLQNLRCIPVWQRTKALQDFFKQENNLNGISPFLSSEESQQSQQLSYSGLETFCSSLLCALLYTFNRLPSTQFLQLSLHVPDFLFLFFFLVPATLRRR